MRKVALPLRNKGGETETFWILDRLFYPGVDEKIVALKVNGDDEAVYPSLVEYEDHCLELTTGVARKRAIKLPKNTEKITIPIEEIDISEPESYIKGE